MDATSATPVRSSTWFPARDHGLDFIVSRTHLYVPLLLRFLLASPSLRLHLLSVLGSLQAHTHVESKVGGEEGRLWMKWPKIPRTNRLRTKNVSKMAKAGAYRAGSIATHNHQLAMADDTTSPIFFFAQRHLHALRAQFARSWQYLPPSRSPALKCRPLLPGAGPADRSQTSGTLLSSPLLVHWRRSSIYPI